MPAAVKPRLHLELSAHGYGHLAQTAPVLNRLSQLLPGLVVSVRSALPRQVLASHLQTPFTLLPGTADIGMLMDSAVDVRAVDSAAAYLALHARREAEIRNLCELYERLRPDLVLVNAPWLPLAACQRAGLPAMALCSLDWATVLETYCGGQPGIAAVLDDIRECYAHASPFLRPQPARDDIDFIHAHAVGPVARLGVDRRALIEARVPEAAGCRLVLVALGGIATALPVARWPSLPGVIYVSNAESPPGRDDWLALDTLGIGFADAMRSVDAVITKPGYGTFVEAICNATRVLYSPRPDWPEEPWLSGWLERHGTAASLERDALWSGGFETVLPALLSRPVNEPLPPVGTQEAAEVLASRWA